MTEGLGGPVKRTGEYYSGIYDATFTMAAGDPARPLDQSLAPVRCFGVQIQNHPDSVGRMLIGNEHSQSTVIVVGQAQTCDPADLSMVYVRSDGSGAITVNVFAHL